VEDYLDNIGISLQEFVEEMTGRWMFGYIRAGAWRSSGPRT
jgi:hypothetical protein